MTAGTACEVKREEFHTAIRIVTRTCTASGDAPIEQREGLAVKAVDQAERQLELEELRASEAREKDVQPAQGRHGA